MYPPPFILLFSAVCNLPNAYLVLYICVYIYIFIYIYIFFLLWRCDPTRFMASSFLKFLDHTQRRITVGRTPLDEWSIRHRDLSLTTLTTNSRAPGGFRTHDLSRRAAADLRLRPRGHWDRLVIFVRFFFHVYQRRTLISIKRTAGLNCCSAIRYHLYIFHKLVSWGVSRKIAKSDC